MYIREGACHFETPFAQFFPYKHFFRHTIIVCVFFFLHMHIFTHVIMCVCDKIEIICDPSHVCHKVCLPVEIGMISMFVGGVLFLFLYECVQKMYFFLISSSQICVCSEFFNAFLYTFIITVKLNILK